MAAAEAAALGAAGQEVRGPAGARDIAPPAAAAHGHGHGRGGAGNIAPSASAGVAAAAAPRGRGRGSAAAPAAEIQSPGAHGGLPSGPGPTARPGRGAPRPRSAARPPAAGRAERFAPTAGPPPQGRGAYMPPPAPPRDAYLRPAAANPSPVRVGAEGRSDCNSDGDRAMHGGGDGAPSTPLNAERSAGAGAGCRSIPSCSPGFHPGRRRR